MIYTSYFSSRKYKPEDGVSIARYSKFWHGATFELLAPSDDILWWWKHLLPEEQKESQQYYEYLYREQILNKLNPQEVAMILEGKTLLCFEKSEDFCHRHIVAKWLRETGFECEERV